MRRFPLPAIAALAALVLVAAAPADAQESHADYGWIPADAETAVERLNASPRHGEWALVRLPNGDSIRSWVVYPERAERAPVVVVIHEIYGLTNWVRGVADQMAAEGFIAVAPDLLTMEGVPSDENGDPEQQAVVAAIRTLDVDDVHRHIRAVAQYAMGLDAALPIYGITGFCWGGSASFEHATRYDDIIGAAPFYGSSPSEASLANVRVPVLGHYGGDDARVNASIPRAVDALGADYWPNIYDSAGHGFLRQQSGRDGANHHASVQAWPMTVGFFRAAAYYAGGDG